MITIENTHHTISHKSPYDQFRKGVTMGYPGITLITASLALFLFVPASYAQSDGGNVYWRIDPNVKSCSMVIDSSLTQDQWHTFVKQVGAISSFKSLASATTLGTGNFHVAVDYSSTPVNLLIRLITQGISTRVLKRWNI